MLAISNGFAACLRRGSSLMGWVVIIRTRWNDADIIGQIRDGEKRATNGRSSNLPAIAGEDDILGRATGEALWPERWPIEKLGSQRGRNRQHAFC